MHSTHRRRSGVTLYAKVANALRAKLGADGWAEGARIPTLEQLAAEFGVARVTVRQACQMLADEGYLRAVPGKGTFVEQTPTRTSLNAALDEFRKDPEQLAIDVEATDHGLALPALGAEHGTPAASYVRVRKRHRVGASPCGWMEVYVAADVFARWPAGSEAAQRLLNLVRGIAGVHLQRGYELLEIGAATDADAARLACAPGQPVARVTRVLCDAAGRVVYLGFNTYRGDRFRYEQDITGKLSYGKART